MEPWKPVDLSGYPDAPIKLLMTRLAYVLGELQFAVAAEADNYSASNEAAIRAYHLSSHATIKDREWGAKQAAMGYNADSTNLKAEIRCWEIERDFILLILKRRDGEG